MNNNEFKVNDKSIVLTHNDLNKVSFPGFSKKELDFVYGMIIALYNKGNQKVTVSFDDMMKAVGLEFMDQTEADFAPWLDSFTSKVSQIICPMYMVDPKRGELFAKVPFFGSVVFSFDEKYLEFNINPSFEYIIAKQNTQYTAFSFGEFKSFKKKYEKLLFRHLSQWKKVGKLSFDMDEFIRLLDIPKSYSPSKIRQTVVDPTVRKLKEFYPDLKATTLKKGNKAIGYEFTWNPNHFQSLQSDELAAKKKNNKPKRKDVTPAGYEMDPDQPTEEEIAAFLKERY